MSVIKYLKDPGIQKLSQLLIVHPFNYAVTINES